MVQIGEILGGMYQIKSEIGHGGTGIIYLAEHLRLQKTVVVKKIMDQFTGRLNDRSEVDILKNLHHTYLPQVYDFLVVNNSVYTIMEYIEGNDLQYYLDHNVFFSEDVIRVWMMQLAEVLEYLHSRKPPILHSDIKPGNIMITKENHICLIDFNISLDGENSKTVQGLSENYAAPEQKAQAEAICYGQKTNIRLDGRMDIYSTGAVFYRMMTGYFLTETSWDVMDMDLPAYSDGLKAIVSKSSKRNPSARFQTASQLRKALEHCEKMDPVYRRAVYIRVGSILLCLLCMICTGVFLYYRNWQKMMEEWNEDYRMLLQYEQTQDEMQICSHGIEMLNDFSYKGYLKEHADDKAKLLHVIGESYFRQENYEEAVRYYEEAWNENPSYGVYCRDYVIALVRMGKFSKARSVMGVAEETVQWNTAEQLLVQAEMAFMNGDMENVIPTITELLKWKRVADTETLKRAYLLASDAYSAERAYGHAVQMLENALNLEDSVQILRELGQTAAKEAEVQSQSSEKERYLKKALECYERLSQRQSDFQDRLNLALTQRALKQYDKSNETLKQLILEYPEDYRIAMWICYNYLDIGNKAGSYQNVREDLEKYYTQAKYLYEKIQTSDEDMQALQNGMEYLRR